MACFQSHLLSYSRSLPNDKRPKFSRLLEEPTYCGSLRNHPRYTLGVANVEIAGDIQVRELRERPKFWWVEISPESMTESQNVAISRLPKKMERRCKALMRQIICFSLEKGSLSDMLGAWVRIMKPRRADWLAVLKELRNMGHPLFLEISELALWEDSFEANVRDYTKMIDLYASENRLQDAENLLSAMNKRGLTCDQVMLTAMIHMYSKAGKFKMAQETFEVMKLLGERLDKRSYGSMIMAYIRVGMPNKGEDLIKEMETQEIYAGREVYKALLRTYSMTGDSEGAQRVFDAIQVAGFFPDSKICGLLVNAYVVAGQSEKACVVFDNMRKAGIEPTDKCVALVLAAYEKDNKVSTAMDLLVNLEREGIMIGKEASEVMVRWFKKVGVVEEVAHVLREHGAMEAAF